MAHTTQVSGKWKRNKEGLLLQSASRNVGWLVVFLFTSNAWILIFSLSTNYFTFRSFFFVFRGHLLKLMIFVRIICIDDYVLPVTVYMVWYLKKNRYCSTVSNTWQNTLIDWYVIVEGTFWWTVFYRAEMERNIRVT